MSSPAGLTLARVDGGARVTTAVVGLLIAFCAVLLAKWLAVVALAALLLAVVLRLALRRGMAAFRGRRAPDAETADPAMPVTDTALDRLLGTAVDRAVVRAVDRTGGPRRSAGVVPVTTMGPPCSWCGLVGGHHDAEGRPVRPRHAHVLPAPERRAS
ncbi:MAG: hypothetical protein K0S40_3491 [Actinomycetospora sp.]|nr:hypothetical protein [Actinomycetospora sp.]